MAKDDQFHCQLFDISWTVKTFKENNLDQKINDNFQPVDFKV